MIGRLALLLVLIMPFIAYNLNVAQNRNYTVLFLVIYIPILLYTFAGKFSWPSGAKKIIQIAGNMNYSSYLIHFPIQLIIVLYFANNIKS